MNSLRARIIFAGVTILLIFLGLTGLILEHIFQGQLKNSIYIKLQGEIFDLLRVASYDEAGYIKMPEVLPDRRLDESNSGLYAAIYEGKNIIWSSPSMQGKDIKFNQKLVPGQRWLGQLDEFKFEKLHAMSYGVSWFDKNKQEKQYTISVAESERTFREDFADFRKGLWLWLIIAMLILLVVQWLILNWGLHPLSKISKELKIIENGEHDFIEGVYPQEIEQLTDRLNALLKRERSLQQRYRDALADLAHSMKTPLTILAGASATAEINSKLKNNIEEQVMRLNELISYQLKRAAASGKPSFAKSLSIKKLVNKILRALQKVHADKAIKYEINIAEDCEFLGEEGDFMEIFGNLFENAHKWCKHNIRCEVKWDKLANNKALLRAVIEDDGPGIPEHRFSEVLQRGVRLDTQVAGHGIGMAIVADIVNAYEGKIEISRSAQLGGAKFTILLPK